MSPARTKAMAKGQRDEAHHMHKSNSSMIRLTAQLMQQNRPQLTVNIALVFIFLVDFWLTGFNLVHRLLIKLKIIKPLPENCVPPAFSPTSPPPFAQWPLTHIFCRLIHLYNLLTNYKEDQRLHHELYCRKPKNDWIRDWATWEGIGHKGEWTEPYPAKDEDSRCPCPGLNVLATHGLIHQSGRKVAASKMVVAISRAFNIAPTMALQLYSPLFSTFSDRGHVFDLESIGIANIIEHDASLLRPDYFLADWKQDRTAMTRPHQDMIDRWFPAHLKHGKLKDDMTDRDFAEAVCVRRAESRKRNRQYSSNVVQSLIGSGSCCLMLNVFGGKVLDLREMAGSVERDLPGVRTTASGEDYGYERMPARTIKVKEGEQAPEGCPMGKTYKQKWQPATGKWMFGMTIVQALWTTFNIEMRARA
ncbi:Chloroperoxidase [Kalmanozyma brasiliensis GHG001]|nr:Chloroperoxidase [Kalmanozyma brasiliensis GHG001]EST06876.2 Chloroperoxidase [Kalmanozyma brasiliensis GHG001]